MDTKTAEVEKQAAQRAAAQTKVIGDDPASQLQGLISTQQSLHRLSSVFSGKAGIDKVKELAQKLGLDCPPDTAKALADLGSNESISEALVEAATAAGKSEQEITQALS